MTPADTPDASGPDAIIVNTAATDLIEEIANIADNSEVIRAAVLRVEVSLEAVLAMIADIKANLPAPDTNGTAPPASWAGTP